MNRTTHFLIPALVTLFLHGMLLVVLTWSWQTAPTIRLKPPERTVVKAKLVQLKAKPPQKKKAKKRTKKKSETKKSNKKKQQERAKKRKAEEARKKKAAEKRKAEKERAAEIKRKAEKKRKEQERLAELERQRKEREERERRQRELEEQRHKDAQQQLSQALEEEEEFLEEQSAEQQAQSYLGVIRRAVERQWSRPPSARNNMEVELVIQLIPTGEVVNVAIAKGSGNSAVDRSAVNAVKKVGHFSELKQLESRVFERYFRRFRLKFRPEDLRL